jgi:gliding motility-associated-like protein
MNFPRFRALILLGLLFSFSLCQAVTYTWSNQVAGGLNYTNGNMVVNITSTNYNTNGPQNPNGGANNGYRSPKYVSAATINTYQGGFTNDYGMPGLVLGVDWPNLTSTTTVTITFTVPVAGPATFNIYDLNIGSFGGNTPVWIDQLTISGTNCSGGLIYPTKTGCGSTTSGPNNNIFRGVMGCTNTTNSFTISSPTIKSITIVYASGSPLASGYGNDPDPQYVIISDITTGDPLTVTVAPNAGIGCTSPSANLSATSNITGATFAWSGPSPSTAPAGTSPNSANTTVSTGGTYTVTATDPATGCTVTASTTVNQSATPPSATITSSGALSCSGSSVTLTASSTTSGVTYAWSNGGTNATNTVTNSGTFTVTITDPLSNCTATASSTVNPPASAPTASITSSGTLSCASSSVTLTASSNTSGVNYTWSNGGNNAVNTVTNSGTFTVTVTNPISNCTATASATVNPPANAPTATIAPPGILSCANTSVTLSASSNASGVTYAWSNGGTNATTSITTPGTFTVTITETATNCTASASTTVSQTTVPPTVTIAATGNLTCVNTTSTLTASTNATNPSYDWGAGNISNTITVSNSGNFTITVTDLNGGCTASASMNILADNTAPSITFATVSNLNCATTVVPVTVAATPSNTTFLWNTGANSATISVTAAGTYTVTATDPTNGCTVTASTTVQIDTAAPIVTITSPTVLGCSSTSATLTANTNASGADFIWSNGANTASTNVTVAGTYFVTITNTTNNCTASNSIDITQTGGLTISIPIPSTLTCIDTTSSISVVASASNLSYLWSNGDTTMPILVHAQGSYAVTVTDISSGCTATATATVTEQLNSPTVSINNPEALSTSNPNVTLTANATNGNATFTWSNGGSSPSTTVTEPGLYFVTATDANSGCTASASTTVSLVVDHNIFVPNAFSPNNDGANDFFPIYGNLNNISYLEIQLFDRWGEKVFESYNHYFAWDGTFKGKPLAPQVLVWQLKLVFIDGYTSPLRKGSLTLIR